MNPVQGEILVIDGDERARALIGQILAEQGFAVTAVGDGSAALRRIEAKPFALVVAETQLPGPLDGTTTIRQARTRQPGLKCLFTSEFTPAAPCNNVALEDFIAKPFHRRDLVGCVFELLQRDAAAGGVVAAHSECSQTVSWPSPSHLRVDRAAMVAGYFPTD